MPSSSTAISVSSGIAKAYENGKPILFYDDNNTCFYIDSIAKGEDLYTLVKGGKTFEVTSNNTLSSTGSVDAPTMENIKDLNLLSERVEEMVCIADELEKAGATYVVDTVKELSELLQKL